MKRFGVAAEGFTPWRALFRKYDVLHLHWPEYYLTQSLTKAIIGTPAILFLVAWLRFRGTRIIWTLHNLHTHHRFFPRAEHLFWRTLTPMLHSYISLNEASMQRARAQFPSLRSAQGVVIPHGHYRGSYPNAVSQSQARQLLGISAQETLLLFFGTISPYKNVPHLIRTFCRTALKDTTLLVAGHPGEKEERRVKDALVGGRRVKLHLERIPAESVQIFFAAADLVVLPFTEIANSGSVMLALSFNRPILVPAQGAMPELREIVGSEWIYTYEGELSPDTLKAGVLWAQGTVRNASPNLDAFDWDDIASETFTIYSAMVNGSDSIHPAKEDRYALSTRKTTPS
jgi:beta-1,4-mannosyltransferase